MKNNIGAFPASYKETFLTAFRTDMVLWFYCLLYTEDEIIEMFEFSEMLLEKRINQQNCLNSILEKTGYTELFLLNMIKSNIPKFYPSLPTLAAFKANVENGLFTGTDKREIINMMYSFTDDFVRHCGSSGRWSYNVKDGAPGINKNDGDFYPKIVVVPDEPDIIDYPEPDPKTDPKQEPDTNDKSGPSTASITMGLGIAVAAAIIYSIAKK